eukprot:CAMPEP_0184692004 /NCGR_PEP_ID=MMETSP0313-20130426/656_1 /TAXON_ID=2792 /ORGANISM="Porphyridium aerugineum, Strain SAG 1380-2" /LENGTH=705 /DNA_ID=CAMNT_0027149797 /DNA_START=919 /DNA_END=3036 /DNA_ORIENTATION=+
MDAMNAMNNDAELFATSWHPTPTFLRQSTAPLNLSMSNLKKNSHSKLQDENVDDNDDEDVSKDNDKGKSKGKGKAVPHFEIINPRAKRYTTTQKFQPWDFSKIAKAAIRLKTGKTTSWERPQRQGVSGTYFIKADREILGVFKPADEEAMNIFDEAEALQRMSSSSASASSSVDFNFDRTCFPPGRGAFREVAAYILDHHNFAKVPQTALAQVNAKLFDAASPPTANPKQGAFQVYVSNLGDAEDFGPGVFLTESIHRIAILDIRVLNCDRHPGNLLVVPTQEPDYIGKNKYEVIPIDHGFILPDVVPTCPWPVWMDWKQSKEALSPKFVKHVQSFDSDMDSKILSDELNGHMTNGSLLTLRIATHLLKRGVELGLSLFDIGSLVFCRDPKREESLLAKIAREALDAGMAREDRLGIRDDDDEEETGHEKTFNALLGPDIMFDMDDIGSVSPIRSRSCSDYNLASYLLARRHPINSLSEGTYDFIARYACRMIDSQLQVMADLNHSPQLQDASPGLSRSLSRVRSIPDFANAAGTRKRRASPSPPLLYSSEEMANRMRALVSPVKGPTCATALRPRPDNLPPLPFASSLRSSHGPDMFPRLDLKHSEAHFHTHHAHHAHHAHHHHQHQQYHHVHLAAYTQTDSGEGRSPLPLQFIVNLPEVKDTLSAVVSSSTLSSLDIHVQSLDPGFSPFSVASDGMVASEPNE